MKNHYQELSKLGKVYLDKSFKNITTIKIGGKIDYLVEPSSYEDLRQLIKYLKREKINYKIVGRGSNLICADREYHGVVIRLNRLDNCYFTKNQVFCEAGLSAIKLANLACDNGFSNLEFISGIPGSIGGLIFMNAGAYKSEIAKVISKVLVLKNDELVWLKASDCDFSYRHSIFKEHLDWIILGAYFKLKKGAKEEIRKVMNNRLERRKLTQPINEASCGSCFKNPKDKSAWEYIEAIGYRAKTYGDLKVSDLHANFIVNTNSAKASDFIALTNAIKEEVFKKFKVNLQLEVEIFDWDENGEERVIK